jgi:hypothetical protein
MEFHIELKNWPPEGTDLPQDNRQGGEELWGKRVSVYVTGEKRPGAERWRMLSKDDEEGKASRVKDMGQAPRLALSKIRGGVVVPDGSLWQRKLR